MNKLRYNITVRLNNYHQKMHEMLNDNVNEKVINQIEVDFKRWLCQNDLFYLLCMTGHNKIAELREIYQPFCDKVSLMTWHLVKCGIHMPSENMLDVDEVVDSDEEFHMQRMWLCYRAFYKTTVVTIGHSCQLLLNFPNIHIVLCHNRQTTSSLNLVAIKNLFLSHPELSDGNRRMMEEEYGILAPMTLKRLFPECVPDGKEWGSTEKFSLNNRTDWNRPEGSVQAVGVDTEITGGHWQVAKKNDLVTEKSVHTEDQIAKTSNWDSRFNQGHFDDSVKYPFQDYEGTRYHFNDLYSNKQESKDIDLMTIPIVKDIKKFLEGDNDQITHPERYQREDIMRMYEDDRWVFMCQMMLSPEDPAKKRFVPEMVSYYHAVPEYMRYYLLVDPATKRKKKSDYTAMTVVGVSAGNKYYVIDMLRDKLSPDDKINKAIELIKRYDIRDVGWEKIGLCNDTFYLEERRRDENLSFAITEIDSHSASKVDRIRDILVPQYAKGQWLWPQKGVVMYYSEFHGRTVDMVTELESEMLQFPNGLHDDMLDTQTFLARMNPTKPIERQTQEYVGLTMGDYVKIKEDRINRENKDPWARMGVVSSGV